MLIWSSVSNCLNVLPLDHTLDYENCQLKLFKNIKYWGKISNNYSNELFVTNVYKNFESYW